MKKKLMRASAVSVSAVLLAGMLPVTAFAAKDYGWEEVDGKYYWYENGVRQGYDAGNPDYRGKEIYDPGTGAWYWLDNVQDGARAVSKDVYQESGAGLWADKLVLNENGDPDPDLSTGKWVRYDGDGHMIKGWDTNENGSYYFDLTYGTMAKGYAVVDGTEYYFNAGSGVMERELGAVPEGSGWKTIDGADFWYENGVRQGYSVDASYRGKEIYDPASDAWYWLDNVDGGKKAVNKDVYQESEAGEWAEKEDGTGKWVRYDENGHMVKGWSTNENGTYYFDPVYGTMAKGVVTIDGVTYEFNSDTGLCLGETRPDGGNDGNDGNDENDKNDEDSGENENDPDNGEGETEDSERKIEWSVSEDGVLTITGKCGADGLLWDEQEKEMQVAGASAIYAPWYEYMDSITGAYVNVEGVKCLQSLFFYFGALQTVDLSDLDTSQVTNMSYMFDGCESITSLDLSGLNTSQVTDMSCMFGGCSALATLDLSGFDTSQVTDMGGMFVGCSALTTLDLSGFDTSQVTDMRHMFRDCKSVVSLDLKSFDTSQVTTMDSMFWGCKSVVSLDLRSFDTSRVEGMDCMFYACPALTSVMVGSGWTTENVWPGDLDTMFQYSGTSSVTYVN